MSSDMMRMILGLSAANPKFEVRNAKQVSKPKGMRGQRGPRREKRMRIMTLYYAPGGGLLTGKLWGFLGNPLNLSAPKNEIEDLFAGRRVFAENATHGRSHGGGAGFFDATHRHAKVLGFENDGGAARVELVGNGVGDLGGEPFLNLGPFGVAIDEAGELGKASDVAVALWEIGDVRLSEEGDEVVLADREKGDVADDDDFIVCDLEGGIEMGGWVFAKATANFGIHPRDPLRGVAETIAIRVLPNGGEDLFYGGSNAVVIDVG